MTAVSQVHGRCTMTCFSVAQVLTNPHMLLVTLLLCNSGGHGGAFMLGPGLACRDWLTTATAQRPLPALLLIPHPVMGCPSS